MRILVTNDDGYEAKGLKTLVQILRRYGDLTIVAPKTSQSGMSMAVSMGFRPIAVKHIPEKEERGDWWYLDGTPASCIKFGLDNVLAPDLPDLVVSGINHGSNAATAAVYSGTIGAAMEAAVNRIPAIGVSLDSFDKDADFSSVEALLPDLLDKLIPEAGRSYGALFNINFPRCKPSEVKGVRVCHLGRIHWEREYRDFLPLLHEYGREPSEADKRYVAAAAKSGEDIYVMAGDCLSDHDNRGSADHILLGQGYVTVTPENIDNTDYEEVKRLCDII